MGVRERERGGGPHRRPAPHPLNARTNREARLKGGLLAGIHMPPHFDSESVRDRDGRWIERIAPSHTTIAPSHTTIASSFFIRVYRELKRKQSVVTVKPEPKHCCIPESCNLKCKNYESLLCDVREEGMAALQTTLYSSIVPGVYLPMSPRPSSPTPEAACLPPLSAPYPSATPS